MQCNRTELLRVTRKRRRWSNMLVMPTPKRPVDQNPLECTFCHSVFPKTDKCAIHMRTCAAMPYGLWIARVRLRGLCPAYAEHACPHCGRLQFPTLISAAKEEKNVGYPLAHVFGTPPYLMVHNCDFWRNVLDQSRRQSVTSCQQCTIRRSLQRLTLPSWSTHWVRIERSANSTRKSTD